MTESMRSQLSAAESTLRESEQRMTAFGELHTRLRELVGHAEFDEGKVVAEWSAADGLTVLDLDPKVMRMPSADLAEAIRTTVRNAVADLSRRTREAVAETGANPGSGLSPEQLGEQLRERLAEARRQLVDTGRTAADGLDRAQQHLDKVQRG